MEQNESTMLQQPMTFYIPSRGWYYIGGLEGIMERDVPRIKDFDFYSLVCIPTTGDFSWTDGLDRISTDIATIAVVALGRYTEINFDLLNNKDIGFYMWSKEGLDCTFDYSDLSLTVNGRKFR